MKKRPQYYKTQRRSHKLTKASFMIILAVGIIANLIGAGQALAETINQARLAPQSFQEYNYEYTKPLTISNPIKLVIPKPPKTNLTRQEVLDMTNEEVENVVRYIAVQENFPYQDYFIRLIRCENLRSQGDHYDPHRTNVAGNYPETSIDVGMVMINDYWHPEISNEMAEDFSKSIRWAMMRIMDGYQHEWSCDRKI